MDKTDQKKRPTGKKNFPRRSSTGLFAKPLDIILEDVTKPAIKKHGFMQARLLTHWPEIIGESLAKQCRPGKVNFPSGKRKNGTLTLHAKGKSALEIQHMEPVILEKLAIYYGYRAIDRIKIAPDS